MPSAVATAVIMVRQVVVARKPLLLLPPPLPLLPPPPPPPPPLPPPPPPPLPRPLPRLRTKNKGQGREHMGRAPNVYMGQMLALSSTSVVWKVDTQIDCPVMLCLKNVIIGNLITGNMISRLR